MKIVHVMNYYMPNMSYQENHLPQNQKKLGNDVVIITSDRYFPFENFDMLYKKFLGDRIKKPGVIEDNEVEIYRLKPLYENVKHASVYLKKREVYKILDDMKPDVIQVHSPKNLNLIYINNWCKKNSCKLFIDCHEDYGNTTFKKNEIKKFLMSSFNGLYKNVFKNTRCFMPITKESYKFLVNEFKVDKDKICINPLGVNTDSCRYDDESRKKLRNKFNFKDDDIVFINTGKVTFRKNSNLIINAFIELSRKYKNIKLFLQGNVESSLKEFIDGKNIIHNSFVKSSELYKYFSMADVAVWSSATNSIQDGISCNKPVIIPNKLNIKHLAEYDNGFAYNNEKELVNSMEYFITNKCKIDELGSKSRELAEKELSWQTIAKQSLEIYERY